MNVYIPSTIKKKAMNEWLKERLRNNRGGLANGTLAKSKIEVSIKERRRIKV